MDLWYLDFLITGEIPNHPKWSRLNARRQEIVKQYVQDIPQKYSIEEIQKDIDSFSSKENDVVFKLVKNFRVIAIITAALVFVMYWILFGFWTGLISGGVIIGCSAYLDNRLGSLIDLSQDSIRLITDFDALLNRLAEAQEKENNATTDR